MKKLYATLFIAALASAAVNAQTNIAKWDFNGESTAATTGTGSLTLIGGVVEGWATGNDPVTGTTDRALNINTFPADGTASGTAGIAAAVSTNGYQDIIVTYDRKGSNTASRWEQFEYTIDGSNWISLGNNNGSTTNVAATETWPTTTYTLPATANNNTNFAVRMVSIFQPSTSAYQPIGTGTYGVAGTWRFDNLTVKGTEINAGVNQNDIAGLKVYPNPLSGNVLNITSNTNGVKEVAIYDVIGKQVFTGKTVNNTVNVNNLTAGVYIVNVTEEGKTATRKLVVK